MGVFDHLPAAARAHLALDGWDGEPRATCDRCPMTAPPRAPYPWSFAPDARCCTAHPRLANFLAGRALLGGGVGRAVVIARLADRDGVSAAGIGPSDAYDARYRAEKDAAFGRDVALRCPFWIGGDAACGVWTDRPSLCRAWSCRHAHGLDGATAWRAADDQVTAIEDAIAALLVARGGAPAGDADDGAWIAWFEACARAAAALAPDDPGVVALVAAPAPRLIALRTRRARPPLPERPTPAIRDLITIGDDVLIAGYSTFDPVRAPRAVFALLARLDGATSWPDALAATAAAGVDEALVRELHRVGAIE